MVDKWITVTNAWMHKLQDSITKEGHRKEKQSKKHKVNILI